MSHDDPLSDLDFRRAMRQAATQAERSCWVLLRDRRLGGFKFRRQHSIGGWTVDFVCLSHRLVLELDGAPHDEPRQRAADMSRDSWLVSDGWTVLRIRNRDLFESPDAVVSIICARLATLTPAASRHPLSREPGEGE